MIATFINYRSLQVFRPPPLPELEHGSRAKIGSRPANSLANKSIPRVRSEITIVVQELRHTLRRLLFVRRTKRLLNAGQMVLTIKFNDRGASSSALAFLSGLSRHREIWPHSCLRQPSLMVFRPAPCGMEVSSNARPASQIVSPPNTQRRSWATGERGCRFGDTDWLRAGNRRKEKEG